MSDKTMLAEEILKNHPTCSITSGRCNHNYHQHCIARWLQKVNNCPIDDSSWIEHSKKPITMLFEMLESRNFKR